VDEKITRLIGSISRVFVEEEPVCENCILALTSGLHVLIEDFPGVGKTTLTRAIAEASGLDFGRIQFTPDILPGDVLGMNMWISGKNDFAFREGQLHHQIIIADELNRASPRTQSAFLEAMQEERITVDGVTHLLPSPFFVIATQNPENFSGTFPLPEAQLDRFGISLSINYPNIESEVRILNTFCESHSKKAEKITSSEEIASIRESVRKISVSQKIFYFIAEIVSKSRSRSDVKLGLSPRSSLHLLYASQGRAYMSGRDFVIPEDVIYAAPIVLPHRLVLSPDARFSGITPKKIISEIVSSVKIPTGL